MPSAYEYLAEWLRRQPRIVTSTLSEEAWKARQRVYLNVGEGQSPS
jgi:hypothetical protein